MIELKDVFEGQRVHVNIDPRPQSGHVVKIGRKYIYVLLLGRLRACLPSELVPWGERF